MSYFIADSKPNLIDKSQMDINIKAAISDEEAMLIQKSLSFLSIFLIISNLNEIVINNGLALKNFLCEDNLKYLVFEKKNTSAKLVNEANRLVMNYCVSSRIFIDRASELIKKLSPSESEIFNSILHDFYDNNFHYRFFYKLRNFIVHCSLPFSVLIKKVPDNIELACKREYLLEYDSWGKVKSELEKMPEFIHLEDYVSDFNICLYAIYLESVFSMRDEITGAHSMLHKLQTKYSLDVPILLTKNNDSLVNSHLLPLPYKELMLATDILKSHPNVNLNYF